MLSDSEKDEIISLMIRELRAVHESEGVDIGYFGLTEIESEKLNSLINQMSKLRIAGIATMKGREESLKDTIESLLPQVDKIYVWYNYEPINKIKHEKVENIFRGILPVDYGDVGKFMAYNENKECHFFSCDDDLIYPSDYCDRMIECWNQKKKMTFDIPGTFTSAIITCHGRIFIPPITDYYKNGIKYHCLNEIKEDVKVDCGGTGVMMFTGQLDFTLADFKTKNMADIWIALFAKKQNVPIICMKHEAGWIKHTDKIDMNKTIHAMNVNDCREQTDLINTVQW